MQAPPHRGSAEAREAPERPGHRTPQGTGSRLLAEGPTVPPGAREGGGPKAPAPPPPGRTSASCSRWCRPPAPPRSSAGPPGPTWPCLRWRRGLGEQQRRSAVRAAVRLRSDVSGLRVRDRSVRGAQKVPENPAPRAATPRCGARRRRELGRGSERQGRGAGGGGARRTRRWAQGRGIREAGLTGAEASRTRGWGRARSGSPGPAVGLASAGVAKGERRLPAKDADAV